MQSCLGRIRHEKEVSLHFHMPERATRYLDSWWCIKEGSIELHSILDVLLRDLTIQQLVVDIEANKEDS